MITHTFSCPILWKMVEKVMEWMGISGKEGAALKNGGKIMEWMGISGKEGGFNMPCDAKEVTRSLKRLSLKWHIST